MPLLPTHFSSYVLPCMNLQFYYKGEENTSAGSSFSVKEVKCSVKKVFLEISQNSQENSCARVACNFIKKETLAQVFSCEFYEISKNTFFYRTPLVAAPVCSVKVCSQPLLKKRFFLMCDFYVS